MILKWVLLIGITLSIIDQLRDLARGEPNKPKDIKIWRLSRALDAVTNTAIGIWIWFAL